MANEAHHDMSKCRTKRLVKLFVDPADRRICVDEPQLGLAHQADYQGYAAKMAILSGSAGQPWQAKVMVRKVNPTNQRWDSLPFLKPEDHSPAALWG
jgi:hypothetical protein